MFSHPADAQSMALRRREAHVPVAAAPYRRAGSFQRSLWARRTNGQGTPLVQKHCVLQSALLAGLAVNLNRNPALDLPLQPFIPPGTPVGPFEFRPGIAFPSAALLSRRDSAIIAQPLQRWEPRRSTTKAPQGRPIRQLFHPPTRNPQITMPPTNERTTHRNVLVMVRGASLRYPALKR